MKRSTIIAAFATVLATLVAATAASAAGTHGKALYQYVGQLQSKTDNSVTVTVQNGNRAALRSLLGQSQSQSFTTGDRTVFLKVAGGVPAVSSIGDLTVGDYVTVRVRTDRDAAIDAVRSTAAASVVDRGTSLTRPDQPLYLFRGTFVSTSDGKVTIDVKGGNRHALRLLIGQSGQQTFSTGPETVFLHWAKRIPTVIGASDLKPGDRIIVRVRADRGASLSEVEATAARRVADREPKSQEAGQNAQS